VGLFEKFALGYKFRKRFVKGVAETLVQPQLQTFPNNRNPYKVSGYFA